jgi:hypothetical protein
MTIPDTRSVTRCRHCQAAIRPSAFGDFWIDSRDYDSCDDTGDSHEPATVCRVIDQAMQWTDSNGRLNIHDGDLILRDYRWGLVDRVSFNPNKQMRVRVEFAGSYVAESVEPSDWVTVRRYIETTS